MSLVVMGASYKSAPMEIREQIAVPEEKQAEALSRLLMANGVKEALLLSTCNRVEVYVDAKTDRLGADAAQAFFQAQAAERFDEDYFYLQRGIATVHHLFKVVCSLDSQVLGEAQILGQVRSAFDMASAQGSCGEVLSQLFKTALRLGKRVRTETAIGSDSVSLSTVAYQQAKACMGDLSGCTVMLVGAGEMAQLAARYLVDGGVGSLLVCNRTPERAQELAGEFGGQAIAYESRHEYAANCDVVFTMTGAESAVLTAAELTAARAAAGRVEARLVLIDESLPRNVELDCARIPGVELYDLEALSAQVDEGLASRIAAVPEVERMADDAEREFLSWLQERLVVPTIKAIYEKGNLTVSDELEHALSELAKERGEQVSEQERRILDAYGNAIMKKLLHGPTIRLRKEAQTADSYYYTGAARYLFGLETFPPGVHHSCQDKPCRRGEACPMGLKGPMREACESQVASAQPKEQQAQPMQAAHMDIMAHIESHLREMGGMTVEDIQAMSGISLSDIQEMGHMTVEEMHAMMGIHLMGLGDAGKAAQAFGYGHARPDAQEGSHE